MYSTLNFKKSVAFIALSALTILSAILIARPAHADLTTSMHIGSRGADVTELQTYLATDSTIYPQGLITGYFGSLTSAAVKRFQSAQGLGVDGIVGPITRARMNTLMGMGGGGDITAPNMIIPTVSSTTVNSATIAWTTNENASGKVYYDNTHLTGYDGDQYPNWFTLSGSIVAESSSGTNHTVTVTGLASHTTYYFRAVSIDTAGNATVSTEYSFMTQ